MSIVSALNSFGIFISGLAVWYTIKILHGFLFRSSMQLRQPSTIRAVFFVVVALAMYVAYSFAFVWLGPPPAFYSQLFHTFAPLAVSLAGVGFISEMSKDK